MKCAPTHGDGKAKIQMVSTVQLAIPVKLKERIVQATRRFVGKELQHGMDHDAFNTHTSSHHASRVIKSGQRRISHQICKSHDDLKLSVLEPKDAYFDCTSNC